MTYLTVYKTFQDANYAARMEIMTGRNRICFVSITPWGAYEVSTHSIPLNAPIERYRRVALSSKQLRTEHSLYTIEIIAVSSWRRN
jgi:hypothetical protein